MKNYYLWDYYEDYGHIGDYDTEAEARAAAKKVVRGYRRRMPDRDVCVLCGNRQI